MECALLSYGTVRHRAACVREGSAYSGLTTGKRGGMTQPRSKPSRQSDRAAAGREPRAPLAMLAPGRHSGEGAASAWETWNQLERHRARSRGDEENALAPPRKPKSP
jgi:hypothetical protein